MEKKYLRWVAMFIPIIFFLDVTLSVIADPYRVYHESWLKNDYFMMDTRKSSAGIIRNAEFDSIILAASMGQNLSPTEASSALNGIFVNLSILGSKLEEKSVVLGYTLKNKKIKTAIISLDGIGAYDESQKGILLDSSLFLYNDNKIDDIKLYLGFNSIGFLFCGNKLFKQQCPGTSSLDNLTVRPEFYEKRFGISGDGFNNLTKERISALKGIMKDVDTLSKPKPFDANIVAKNLKRFEFVFKDSMLGYVDSYPETNFYFYLPPCSRVYDALLAQYDPTGLVIYTKSIKIVTNSLEKYSNAKLFGFGESPFVDDLANFMDICHYHKKFDSAMLKWIKNGKGELLSENLPNYFSKVDQQAYSLDLVELAKEIKNNIL
jgi:hypothetical protein